jgi:hypothetical protein
LEGVKGDSHRQDNIQAPCIIYSKHITEGIHKEVEIFKNT